MALTGAVVASSASSLAADLNTAVVYCSLKHNQDTPQESVRTNAQGTANVFAAELNAPVLEILVSDTYPDTYNGAVEQAQQEQEALSLVSLKSDPDVSAYDTIFVGFSVWGGTYPRAIASWLHNHDFTGNDIYVFTSHMGSGLGQSVELMCAEFPQLHVVPLIAVRAYSEDSAETKAQVQRALAPIAAQ
ncbi:MAG: hypothetical protein H9847_03275 [Candidatus Anaerobiospirillum pullicola]|uniref:Flavodoxin-like domain-containing protein n=1 Tax=Candidatus Anaerobiospirillum pullicola TaxID=2838451 RepID=A0A948WXK2_9GAMM|nr:hypothetical protein [Candidatus Anaerobiospirillum pullicola]